MTAVQETIEQVVKLKKAGWGPTLILGAIGIGGYFDSRSNIISKLENYQVTVTNKMTTISDRIRNLEIQVAVQNGFNSRIERLETNLLEISKYLKNLKKEDIPR